jgi:hypothetical protein
MKTQFPTKGIISLALGVLLTGMAASAATRYVWQDSPSPSPPHTNWATAAHNIQKAVDAAEPGDTVLVTNGVYATRGRAVSGSLTNRVAIDKAITVQSVMGPQATLIVGAPAPGGTNGDGAIRCVYVGSNAVLSGFTLTNGHTRASGDWNQEQSGGGAWCEISGLISNCTLTGNSAYQGGGVSGGTLYNCTLTGNSANSGGGAADGTLTNCTLTGNSAGSGGGARGGTLYNCTLTANSSDDGGGAYLSTLSNCTLSGNSASHSGGGAAWGTLNHCMLTGNSASEVGGGVLQSSLYDCTLSNNSASRGGGAWGERLYRCVLRGNSATENGGGAKDAILYNCVLLANSATNNGGGAHESTLVNCTLCGNTAGNAGGGARGSDLRYCIIYRNTVTYSYLHGCCTWPAEIRGTGTLTNDPLFVDYVNGNLRLQSNSPCINACGDPYSSGETDLDGLPRVVGGMVDMGAYECQSPSLLPYFTWLQSYGLPTQSSMYYADCDGDGLNNWQEWRCRTDPTNALSVLRVLPPVAAGSNVNVTWQSVAGVSYFLERSTNLATAPRFTPLATGIRGQASTTMYTETNAVGAGPFFYRVGVDIP